VTARRRLQVTIEVEIIDQSERSRALQNKSLRRGLTTLERAEGDGRKQAIGKLVQKIIEGDRAIGESTAGASALDALFQSLIVAATSISG